MIERGIYYIATGDTYAKEAHVSASQIREVMPSIKIAIATNKSVDEDLFDIVINVENASENVYDQLKYLSRTPFEKTINIDTDIYMNCDVSELFELLEYYDMAACINARRPTIDVPDVPDSFPEYNTGVLVFRNSSSFNNFVKKWEYNFNHLSEQFGINLNQPSFRKTLFSSDLHYTTLPPEYNCILWRPGQVSGEVKIFHGRITTGKDVVGKNYNINIDHAIKKLNSTESVRVFTQIGGFNVYHNKKNSLINRVRFSLRYRGPLYVLNRGKEKVLKWFVR